jgi:excisionase family DNA binding protein
MKLPEKEMFRVEEVAKILSVSKSAVYAWVNDGRLKAKKVAGSSWRIKRETLMEIMQ